MAVTSTTQDAWNAQDIELRTRLGAEAGASDARLAAAFEALTRKPSREELVWRALMSLPEVTGQTDLQMVDLATRKVDAYLTRFPGAVRA